MGIYGEYAHRLMESESNVIFFEESLYNDTRFIDSLNYRKTTLVTESVSDVIKTIIEKFKKMIEKFVNFIKSIPSKIMDILRKIFKKKQETVKEIKEKNNTTEDKSSNTEKNDTGENKKKDLKQELSDKLDEKPTEVEYTDDKKLYKYPEMAQAIYDSGMISSYYSNIHGSIMRAESDLNNLENNFGKTYIKNSSYFSNIKSKNDFFNYINTDEFKDKFAYNGNLKYKDIEAIVKEEDNGLKILRNIATDIEDVSKKADECESRIDQMFNDSDDEDTINDLKTSINVMRILEGTYGHLALIVKNYCVLYQSQCTVLSMWLLAKQSEHGAQVAHDMANK